MGEHIRYEARPRVVFDGTPHQYTSGYDVVKIYPVTREVKICEAVKADEAVAIAKALNERAEHQ